MKTNKHDPAPVPEPDKAHQASRAETDSTPTNQAKAPEPEAVGVLPHPPRCIHCLGWGLWYADLCALCFGTGMEPTRHVPAGGDEAKETAWRISLIAHEQRRPVLCSFNEVDMVAVPGRSAEVVFETWDIAYKSRPKPKREVCDKCGR